MPQNHSEHINFIWTVANLLRGPYRPPQYRKVMLPMTVLKRLDSVLEPTKDKVIAKYEKIKDKDYPQDAIDRILEKEAGHKFYNTSSLTFSKMVAAHENIAQDFKNYIKSFSPNAQKIIERFKFEGEIEKLDEANRLFKVMKEFVKIDLSPAKVSNLEMGYIFEELIRKFNEQANEEAGDYFTPREVIRLMTHALYAYDDDFFNKEGLVVKIYDPTCGTGGMLSISEEYIHEHSEGINIGLFGQEYNDESWAICAEDITRLYGAFEENEHSKIFDNQEFGYIKLTVERPLRLNFKVSPERIEKLWEETSFQNLVKSKKRKDKEARKKEIEKGEKLQQAIVKALSTLDQDHLYKDREKFLADVDEAMKKADIKLKANIKKAIWKALGEQDQNAEICRDKNGNPEPDTDLRDNENIPLPKEISLPLPYEYDKDSDLSKLLPPIKPHCELYMKEEVLPHVPDAWVDWDRTRIGYEIPMNRHFYEYKPPRELSDIEADIKSIEKEIVDSLAEITGSNLS
jgi:hypothetical protein